MFRIYRLIQQGHITFLCAGGGIKGGPWELPRENDAQAAILSREEYSKQREYCAEVQRPECSVQLGNLQIHYDLF